MNKLFRFLTSVFCCLVVNASAQKQIVKKNTVGFSIPVVWNSSEAPTGSKINSGSAFSYGIHANYSRTITKNVFGLIGIGYFKQAFGINRSFEPELGVSGPALYLQKYSYNNIHFKFGFGYNHGIGDNTFIKAAVDFNEYYCFSQSYGRLNGAIDRNSMLGQSVNLSLGTSQKLTNHFSIGADAIFPVVVNWKTDKNFGDDPEIARNKFSAGIELSGKYHF